MYKKYLFLFAIGCSDTQLINTMQNKQNFSTDVSRSKRTSQALEKTSQAMQEFTRYCADQTYTISSSSTQILKSFGLLDDTRCTEN